MKNLKLIYYFLATVVIFAIVIFGYMYLSSFF